MQNEITTIEATPLSAIESITRGEIDVQIATAHRFPRSMQTFKRRAIEMATLDEETAAFCLYSRPVGGGKFAEGLSVRTAEIVGACYGNLRVGAMIVEQTERYVTARGMAHDLESNFASSCEVIESTVKRDGTPYDERMRVVIAKACLAKARRDATFQVVPKALCKPIESAARAIALGDATTLASRREAVMGWIGKLGIDPIRVFSALGIKGPDEIGLEELATLTGLKTAIKDGEVSVDDAFPQVVKDAAKSPLFKKNLAPTAQTAASPASIGDGAQASPNEAAESLFESERDRLADVLRYKLAAAGLKWSDVLAKLQESGMGGEEFVSLESADEVTLRDALEHWNGIAKALGGKGGK